MMFFLKNSSEAILQLQPSKTAFPYAVIEQNALTATPVYYLTLNLVNAFEPLDKRKATWTKSVITTGGINVLHPFKYKIRQGTNGGNLTEYYMVLCLAEQYLIRAEARAKQNNLTDAISDINVIRQRAGLTSFSNSLTQQQVLDAIAQERRIELFAEWGHRWFDLIRTDKANAILSVLKGSSWQPTDQFYPIPLDEIKKNPNLTQNDGYK